MCRYFAPIALAMSAFASSLALAQPMAQAAAPTKAATPSSTEATRAWTLAHALQIALESHPELAAARHEIDAMQGARVQAGAWPNPVLEAQLEDQQRSTRTTTLTLSQPIELWGKRGARISAAERGVDLARTQLQTREIELRANVTAAFFAALVAQERVRIAQASLDLATRGTDAAGKRVTAGKVSPVEETKAKVAEAGVRIELIQAQGELRTQLAQLGAAVGLDVAIPAVDGDALQTPRLPTRQETAARVDDAPSLREARLEVRRLDALVELEQAKRLPDVALTLGAKRDQEIGRNQAIVGIAIPLPVFDTNRGNVQEAIGRRNKAMDSAQAIELRVRAEATAARQRLEIALDEVAALREQVLPGAQGAFDAASKGFELGKFSYLEALDAQRTLLQSRSQFLRSLAEAHRAQADLQRLLGASDASPSSSTPASSKDHP